LVVKPEYNIRSLVSKKCIKGENMQNTNIEERNCEYCKLYRKDECNGIGDPNTCADYEKVYTGYYKDEYSRNRCTGPCWAGWY